MLGHNKKAGSSPKTEANVGQAVAVSPYVAERQLPGGGLTIVCKRQACLSCSLSTGRGLCPGRKSAPEAILLCSYPASLWHGIASSIKVTEHLKISRGGKCRPGRAEPSTVVMGWLRRAWSGHRSSGGRGRSAWGGKQHACTRAPARGSCSRANTGLRLEGKQLEREPARKRRKWSAVCR